VILYCGTSNLGKLREFQLASPQFDIRAITAWPPEETGATFDETAREKALYYGARQEGYVFADDSGLEVDALGCGPGVLSARFAGVGATDAQNNALLLERLRGVENRASRFVCSIALVCDGQFVRGFRGVVEGRILEEGRGTHGFGYDPLFYHEGFGCTFGEATDGQKMSVSHRGQALRGMFAFLESIGHTGR
jgi:XTP/dITP diphosphohydrolase